MANNPVILSSRTPFQHRNQDILTTYYPVSDLHKSKWLTT